MILDEIIEAKKEELTKRKQTMPLARLEPPSSKKLARRKQKIPLFEMEAISSKKAPSSKKDFGSVLVGGGIRLIAEVKKASPAKGLLCPDFDPLRLARTYADNGAAAISVLTEERYFQGSLEHLAAIEEMLNRRGIPLLRKDFIFDPYQVYESRAYGADALLLIAAILSREQLTELLGLSHSLGMQCLVEVHDEAELESAISSGAKIIGINNRDLRTLAIDLTTTKRLRPLVPEDRIVVSESGIKSRADVQVLREWGVDAILVGEALVTAEDVAAKIREFL